MPNQAPAGSIKSTAPTAENPLGTPSGHGSTDRGLIAAATSTATPRSRKAGAPPRFEGRFGRMFPGLRGAAFRDDDMRDLAIAMSADNDPPTPETELDTEENLGIPAGYTYFGQFVDHDMSLDAVSISMKQEDLADVENFRTPALDLDSVYGRGPDDQPYLYGDRGQLLMADRLLTAGTRGADTTHDLPRFKGRAMIGDKRNDENVIVSQLHGLFMRFHNYFILEKNLSFDEARKNVQWHYQWLVICDYLPRIVGRDVVASILPHFAHGTSIAVNKPQLKLYVSGQFPFMPVEFAGAAYRFGHSMVRPLYRLNASDEFGRDPVNPTPGRLAVFRPPASGPGLNGFQEFNSVLGIDWSLFFETDGRRLKENFLGKDRIQPAYKIDTSLVAPLTRLPEFSDAEGMPRPPAAINRLALRNLMRGMQLQLPSGQAVAQYMIDHGVPGIRVLGDDELLIGKADADGFDNATPISTPPVVSEGKVNAGTRSSMQDSSPLWFYVLAEARWQWKREATQALADAGHPKGLDRQAIINRTPTRLGPMGARLVAETIIGLVLGDEHSFLNSATPFQPAFGRPGQADFTSRFQMGDLTAMLATRLS